MSVWRWAAARVAGAAHRAAGRPCEDFYAVAAAKDGTLTAVVCDGAGSAPRGAEGARLGCEAFLRYVATNQRGDDPASWGLDALSAVRAAIAEAAGEQPLSAFACTLLAVHAAAWGSRILQVGDGAVVLRDALGAWRLALPPQRGEFANETVFVTSADAAASMRVLSLPEPPAEFALMTDGVEFLAIRQATLEPHGAFFDHVFAGMQDGDGAGERPGHAAWLAAFLGSPEADARIDDDKTLVIAVRTA